MGWNLFYFAGPLSSFYSIVPTNLTRCAKKVLLCENCGFLKPQMKEYVPWKKTTLKCVRHEKKYKFIAPKWNTSKRVWMLYPLGENCVFLNSYHLAKGTFWGKGMGDSSGIYSTIWKVITENPEQTNWDYFSPNHGKL